MALSTRYLTTLLLTLGLYHTGCIQKLPIGSDSGTGGAGGQTTTQISCTPSDTRACYDGPDGTAGVGPCKGGTQTCAADGLSWGHCAGEVLPSLERCDGQDTNCDGSTACAAPSGWAKPYGQDFPYQSEFFVASVGPDHNLYVAGRRHHPVQSPDDDDPISSVFILKVTPAGDLLLERDYDCLNAEILGIGADEAGNIHVTGTLGDHIDFGGGALQNPGWHDKLFVAKLDPSGQQLWANAYGADVWDTHGDIQLAVDGAGYTVVYGDFHGSIDFGDAHLTNFASAGWTDTFIAKFDPDGHPVFARKQTNLSGLAGYVRPMAMGMDASGNFVTAGRFTGDLDVGGPTPLHTTDVSPASTKGSFVVKYDAAGDVVWQKSLDGPLVNEMAVSPAGDVITAGHLVVETDFGGGGVIPLNGDDKRQFLARWDATGAHVHSDGVSTYEGSVTLGARITGLSARVDGIVTLPVAYQDGADLSDIGGPVYPSPAIGLAVAQIGPDNHFLQGFNIDADNSMLSALLCHFLDDGMGGFYATGAYSAALDLGVGALPDATNRYFLARFIP